MGLFRKATVGDWIFLGLFIVWEKACDGLAFILDLVERLSGEDS